MSEFDDFYLSLLSGDEAPAGDQDSLAHRAGQTGSLVSRIGGRIPGHGVVLVKRTPLK